MERTYLNHPRCTRVLGAWLGKTGQRDSRVVVVEGNEVQLVGEGGKRRASATVTINGTTMTSAQHCPESDQQVVTFTATATQLLIFIPMSAQADGGTSRTRVQTYDRQ